MMDGGLLLNTHIINNGASGVGLLLLKLTHRLIASMPRRVIILCS